MTYLIKPSKSNKVLNTELIPNSKFTGEKEILFNDLVEMSNNDNNRVILFGGAVRDLLTGDKPRDFDLYVQFPNTFYENLAKHYNTEEMSDEGYEGCISKNILITSEIVGIQEINIVSYVNHDNFSNNLSEHRIRADLTVNSFCFELGQTQPGDKLQLYFPKIDGIFQDLIAKKVKLNPFSAKRDMKDFFIVALRGFKLVIKNGYTLGDLFIDDIKELIQISKTDPISRGYLFKKMIMNKMYGEQIFDYVKDTNILKISYPEFNKLNYEDSCNKLEMIYPYIKFF